MCLYKNSINLPLNMLFPIYPYQTDSVITPLKIDIKFQFSCALSILLNLSFANSFVFFFFFFVQTNNKHLAKNSTL